MSGLHNLLAEVALALALLGAVWSAGLLVAGRPPGPLYIVNLVWVVGVLLATAVLGLVVLVTASGPRDPLHFVYSVLAIVALPIAAAVGADRPARHRVGVGLVASVVLLILILRLFQTGA